jgi:hypothetical protein
VILYKKIPSPWPPPKGDIMKYAPPNGKTIMEIPQKKVKQRVALRIKTNKWWHPPEGQR